MAAYAALVSLSHVLHQILHLPPLSNIIIPRHEVETLQEKVGFLIDFLENCPIVCSQENANLERQIKDAAYEAQDLIESDVVEQIRAPHGQNTSTFLCEVVQKSLEKFLLIEKELMKMRDMRGVGNPQTKSFTAGASSGSLPSQNSALVGFDKFMNQILEALATNEPNRKVIAIVGMGGIGKTTLATAIYNNPCIVEGFFDVHAWVTISQEYTVRELLLRLLSEISKSGSDKRESTDDELGLELHKELFGRKYLIVMDDMWDIHAWEKVQRFLPSNNNGNRILVTTRLSKLADDIGSPFPIGLLDEEKSWDLLRRKVFGNEDCPSALLAIGKLIAKRCRGLPLALVVIGGLLSRSEWTIGHWNSIAQDVTSALNSGNDERVTDILSLSYSHLPIYLKPCFLYLAMLPEDYRIRVSTLIRLWVAEGLIRPTQTRCLEEVAHDYLEDLTSRSLILVHKRGSSGKVNFVKMHDLIRDFCIEEAKKEEFLYIVKLDNTLVLPNIEAQRRLSISFRSKQIESGAIASLKAAKYCRSWLSHGRFSARGRFDPRMENWQVVDQTVNGFSLLKVVHVMEDKIHVDILNLSNLRYVVADAVNSIRWMSSCWNLQTLVVNDVLTLPAEVWQMPQIRHLEMYGITLHDPPDNQNVTVLENLQTLKTVRNFKCTDQILKRIPNLKEMHVAYYFDTADACSELGDYCVKNLVRLAKLESLGIYGAEKIWMDIAFPISLRELTLWNCNIPWEDLTVAGKLPSLEVLKLYPLAAKGKEWNTVEGEYRRLKYLLISCCELEVWGAENIPFPRLEHLRLRDMKWLEEIPMSLAEISTLRTIILDGVKDSVRTSARAIIGEQENLGYDGLRVWTYDRQKNRKLQENRSLDLGVPRASRIRLVSL